MAHRHKLREKLERDTQFCNCIVAVFQVLVACQSITFISGQGFLYPSAEVQSQKLLNGISLFPRQQALGVTSEKLDKKLYPVSQSIPQIRIIRFEPPFLDFNSECVGMPKLKTVYIHNPSKERDLQLTSISARTSHFHSSFFENKIVPPGGNTSFEVVFLARVIGNVENTLFINTLYGTFPYQVFGVGIPNPYRLRPYLGAKVPINSSFSPLISMHNPTSQPLQVTEMYSSSGYLQLQLPTGEHEVDKDQWEIPPYETKQVMRAKFLGQVEANHTAFIRIKTTQTETSDFHILPVEVEVSSAPGIYSSVELLDFGTIRTQYDDPKTLPLFLLNSGSREVVISSVTLSSHNPAVSIDFKAIKLSPSESTFTRVANVTFTAVLAKSEESNQRGGITVKTKEKSYPTVEIPFTAELLDGTLGYDEANTLFHREEGITEADVVVREISLSNMFPFPVILQNVTLAKDANRNFKVVNFKGPVTLPRNSQMAPFSIQYIPSAEKQKISDDGTGTVYYLALQTNASRFSLPLHTYSGVVSYKVLREDTKKIDFGIMGTNDKRRVLFALYNRNPTSVTLEVLNSTLSNTSIRLVSVTQGADKNLTEEAKFNLHNFELPSNSCSVFEVKLTASEKEEEIIGAVNLFTKYQEIRIPMLARVVVGALTVKPEKIKLQRSFPGLIVHQALTITNTFAQVTTLDSVHFNHPDKRFYYKKSKNQPPNLDSNKKAKIGKVYFDARQSCKPDRCYVGLPTSTTVGHHWLTTLALGLDSVEFDTRRYREFRQRWKNLQEKGLKGPNATLVLETNVIMNFEIPVQASLYWPSLLEESTFNFPLTHVGKKSVAVLSLLNPSDSPVIVQVLPLSLYPAPKAILDSFGWSDMALNSSFIMNNSSVFHLLDPRFESGKDSKTSQMVWLEYTLNGKLNHSVANIFLDPGQRVNIKVEFVPYNDQLKSTVLLLRNNLTILDAITMHGRGVYEHMTLGGKSPNLQSSMLRFKITRDILKDCIRTPKKLNPSFTVRKWFHANNTGLLPIHITSVSVNGSPCEGYGFRVLDCDQFILQPNSTKKLEIAFTPDFTSYLVLHQLKLVTAQGKEMVFVLNVTLPPTILPLCQSAVPRPTWEPALYYFIAVVMVILFIGIVLMSYLEAIHMWEPFARLYEIELQQREDAVVNGGVRRVKSQAAPEGFGKRFDLRNIATSFITTVTSTQQQIKSESPITRRKNLTSSSTGDSTPSSPADFTWNGRLGMDVRQDTSQQTDPHPDFPPLNGSNFFSSCSRGFFSAFSRSKANSKDSKEPPAADTSRAKPERVETNTGQQTCLRQRTPLVANSAKTKNNAIKIFTPSNMTTPSGARIVSEVNPHVAAEIEHYAQILSNFNPEPPGSKTTTRAQEVADAHASVDKTPPHGGRKSQLAAKLKLDTSEIAPSSNSSDTHAQVKKEAIEKRRKSSSSSRRKRASTSSSTSADLAEFEIQSPLREQRKERELVVEVQKDEPEPVKSNELEKGAKPARGKKLRKTKLSRKQIKAAMAKEREDAQAAGTPCGVKMEDKASTPSDEEKTIPELKPMKKPVRPSKQRSLSTSSAAANPTETKSKTEPERKKVVRSRQQSPVLSETSPPKAARKPSPKRRSNSYSYDNGKGREKTQRTKQYTIFKNPNASDSRSSSPQVSESSSSDCAPLWDTPIQNRDPNQEMVQLSKQSRQADLMMEEKKERRDRKQTNKGNTSPAHLTSSSRSSSYSSMVSSASSNEGYTNRKPSTGGAGTPKKMLTRSVSDATSGVAQKPQLRKRNPYPVVTAANSISPSRAQSKETPFEPSTKNIDRDSPKSPPPGNLPPSQTYSSSPSMFTNHGNFEKGPQPNGDQNAMGQSQAQWAYQNQPTSSYSAFGQSSFNFMESLIRAPTATTTQNTTESPTWGSPFSDSSSFYSTPSPQNSRGSPRQNMSMRPTNWNSTGNPVNIQSPYPGYDDPPGTPTTPGMPLQPTNNGPLGWGDIPSPTSTNMSTHSIWSVSNAVTMDENRNDGENDLLGLKSIWSNPRSMRNPDWHDQR